MKKKLPKLSKTFARWLLLCVLIAFAVTTAVIWLVQTHIAKQDAYDLLRLNIRDVYLDIVDASNENMLALTKQIAGELNLADPEFSTQLAELARKYDVSEINIVNAHGIITASTEQDFLGFDMASGSQSAEFLVLLEGTEGYVQSYRPVSYDSSISRKYAGAVLPGGGFVQVGYDAERFQRDIRSQVIGVTRNRHVGENGCIILCNEAWQIVSAPDGGEGQSLFSVGLPQNLSDIEQAEMFEAIVYGEASYCTYLTVEGYYAIAILPRQEVTQSRNISAAITLGVECVIFVLLFIVIYLLLKRRIVDNVRSINVSLSRITGGDLDERVNVGGSEEFSALSEDINATVATLKRYITDAEKRVDQELEFARTIQRAALPSVFPPYPNRKDFAIYACTDPAREVGGDFYDFYLLNDRTLAFLVADVSGKEIPAALFMMQAKTLLKSLAESGLPVEEILNQANDKLCQGNEANMFVTVWMGILDLGTGVLRYANAGHNPPLLRRAGGSFALLNTPGGLVLAGMEGITYRAQTLQLQPGDVLYLYTDGVTEAADAKEELFGTQRLQDALNRVIGSDPEALCNAVLKQVDRFVGDAPQFDDITMLSVLYIGDNMLKELNITAVPENLEQVTAFVEAQLEQWDCPPKVLMQLTLAVEEVFINISSYAYDPEIGPATIRVEVDQEPMEVSITFMDKGKPYDPLQKKDPDLSLSAEDRQVGGLGIFLVKKTVDDIHYEYADGKNILRIVKRW